MSYNEKSVGSSETDRKTRLLPRLMCALEIVLIRRSQTECAYDQFVPD